jgi:hypothetical protein
MTKRALYLLAFCLCLATGFALGTPGLAHDYYPQDPGDYYPPPSDCCEHHHGYDHHDWRTIDVDCSGTHRDMFRSVQAAIDRVRPNGTVMILPPGEGMTCRESLTITKPVTISTYGGGHAAVIQAPDGRSCAEANVPLGDSLVFDGITFIARGHSAPCIRVRAGHVVVRNSTIDSRNTDWAFDVLDSGELSVEDTKVETDGAGVHALRAEVHLKNTEIDMSPNRRDAALLLDRTDGDIQGGEIIGGRWGVVASPGPHGLTVSDLSVRNANTGVEFMPGAQGTIHADRLSLASNRNAIVIGPYVQAEVLDSAVTRTIDNGLVVYGADAHIDSNRFEGGRVGIRIAAVHQFDWTDLPFNDQLYDRAYDPAEPGVPEIVGNTVADVDQAAVLFDHDGRAHVVGNKLFPIHDGVCVAPDDEPHRGGNECHGERH